MGLEKEIEEKRKKVNKRYTIKAHQIRTQRNRKAANSTAERMSAKEKVTIFSSKYQENQRDFNASRHSSRVNTINVDLQKVSTLHEDLPSPIPGISAIRSPSFITQVPQRLMPHVNDSRRKTESFMPSRRKIKRLEQNNSELNPLEQRSNSF